MKKFLTYTLLGVLLAGCAGGGREPLETVVDKALAGAERQTLLMAEKYSAREGRLPRTWENGEDVSSDSRWWCSGFFPGVLWYVYENGRNPRVLEYARMFTARVEREKHTTDNHDVGFMLYCSFGNGLRLTGDKSYEEVLLSGARSLATRFKPEVGLIRSWDHNRDKWQYPVIIDNMMNLEHLYNAGLLFGDDTLKSVAVTHANTTLCNHFRPDFTSYHLVDYDPADGRVRRKETVQGFSDESAWARGQAWALYGYTMMFRLSGYECYLNQAENIAGMLLERLPDDGIPYWDFDSDRIPDDLRDASAAAIMASAFVDLSSLTNKPEEKGRYLKMAEKQLRTLASDAYLARPGENGNFLLMHSVGSRPDNHEIDVPLTYADYYFLEALLKYSRTTQTKPNNN